MFTQPQRRIFAHTPTPDRTRLFLSHLRHARVLLSNRMLVLVAVVVVVVVVDPFAQSYYDHKCNAKCHTLLYNDLCSVLRREQLRPPSEILVGDRD